MAYRIGKIGVTVISLGMVLSLSACGEDLTDRPYVMACTGTTYKYTGEANYYQKRFDLPNWKEVLQGARASDTADPGFLAYSEGLSGNTSRILLSGTERSIVESNAEVHHSTTFRKDVSTQPASGLVEVEHYYLTGDGELHEVKDFFTASGEYGAASEGPYEAYQRTIATTLPSDATYAVYRIKGHNWSSSNRDANGEPKITRRGQTGYWVAPLQESERWQPVDAEDGLPPNRNLKPYVEDKIGKELFDTMATPTDVSNRRAHEDVDFTQCFARPGSTMKFSAFYEPARRNDEGRYIAKDQVEDMGVYFVGDKEDVLSLPQDPSDFL